MFAKFLFFLCRAIISKPSWILPRKRPRIRNYQPTSRGSWNKRNGRRRRNSAR
jgi:hypothetical protein